MDTSFAPALLIFSKVKESNSVSAKSLYKAKPVNSQANPSVPHDTPARYEVFLTSALILESNPNSLAIDNSKG